MTKHTTDTRFLLMETAGKLIAEHGYDKVSTRTVADTAKVNLGGIHYHFGSKEKLYIAAFKYAVEMSKCSHFGVVITEYPELLESPEGQAEIICIVAERIFADHIISPEKAWMHQLITRELYFPTPAMERLAKDVLRPDLDASMKFFQVIKPGAALEDIFFWRTYISSNAMFYTNLQHPLKVSYPSDFEGHILLKNAEQHITVSLLNMLGLPVPDKLYDRKS